MSQVAAQNEEANTLRGTAVFGRLFKLLRPQWGWIATALALLLVSLPGELFPGLVWMYVTDSLILDKPSKMTRHLSPVFSLGGSVHGKFQLLLSAVIWMFVVYVACETLETVSSNMMQRAAQQFILNFRNKVYAKLQEQSLAYLQRQRVGDLMSRAMGDVDELQAFIVGSIDVIIGEGAVWLGCVALVLYLDWKVASISLAPLVLVYFLLRYFNARIGPIYKVARERAGNVSTRLQENLAGVVVIKIFGREKQEAQRFRDATAGYYEAQVQSINARSIFFPFSRAVGFFSNIFMIGVGGYSILSGGSFTVGTLLAFRAYWWRLFGPIQTLARVNDMVQRAVAAGRRVFEVLDAPDELPDSSEAGKVGIGEVKELALDEVTFSYAAEGTRGVPAGDHPAVLKDVSIRIGAGETVALCGPSGSGKSTVLNLLLRFYDPTKGRVTLGERDLRSITRESLRQQFALVQQETFLFNDSILDNIRYGHAEATMQQVVAASQAGNAHEFISKMPNGYDTKVGERGVRLSGGQKQRISIARAFLANPPILLLDEPTSSVEPDSEATIIAALDRLMVGRTTVLTSHRPSLILQADRVYVIEEGRVTEQGSPRELMRESEGWFGRFMRSVEEAGAVGL